MYWMVVPYSVVNYGQKGETYGAIAESYAGFIIRHKGQAARVFDRYGGDPTIKDNAHQ